MTSPTQAVERVLAGKCPRTSEPRDRCLCLICDPEDKRLDAELARVAKPRTDGSTETVVRCG